MEKGIYLESERLVLRDHVEADGEGHHRIFSDHVVMRYLPELKKEDQESSEADLKLCMDQVGEKRRKLYFLRIELKGTGEHVGEIGYTVEDFEERRAGLGYFMYPQFWGKGYMTEAVKCILQYAFEVDGIQIMDTGCLKENVGSEKVMIKNGFHFNPHGENQQFHEGEWKERVNYTMTKEQWKKLTL